MATIHPSAFDATDIPATRKAKIHFDDILYQWVGEFGRYQAFQFILVALPCALIAAEAMSWTFTGADIPHRCQLVDEEGSDRRLVSFDAFENLSLPLREELRCRRPSTNLSIDVDAETALNRSVHEACNGNYLWYYDHSEVKRSGVDRWKIVCDRQYIQALVQAAYYIGQLVGSSVIGYLADRFGRKTCFITSIVVKTAASIAMAFVPIVEAFAFLRAVCGFCHPGVYNLGVILGVEMVGPRFRMMSSILCGVFFALGEVYLALVAYALRDYRQLQLAIALPGVLCICYWWLLPESTRWLLSRHQYERADEIIRKAAKWNGRGAKVPPKWWSQYEIEDVDAATSPAKTERNYNFLDLVRTPNLRRRTAICCVLWPVVAMVYYGLTMIPAVYGGSMYVTFILSAIGEVVGSLIGAPTTNWIGRKLTIMLGYGVGGTLLLCSIAIPNYMSGLLIAFAVGSQCAIGSTFDQLFIQTPELYPTVTRSLATGLCATFARLGAIFASLLALWLAKNNRVIIMLVFGFASFVACFLTMFLPETAGYALSEYVHEAEEFGVGRKFRADFGGSLCRRRNEDGATDSNESAGQDRNSSSI